MNQLPNKKDFGSVFNLDPSQFALGYDEQGFEDCGVDVDELSARLLRNGAEASSFGVRFVDECVKGVSPTDFVVVSAPPGLGKTQLAISIAVNSARVHKKRVYLYALEAYKGEIQDRLVYRAFAKQYFEARARNAIPAVNISLTDYVHGEYVKKFPDLMANAVEEVNELRKYIKIFYPTDPLDLVGFRSSFMRIKNNADLIVVDHLHFIDFGEEKETSAIKAIVHEMKSLSGNHETPIILVSHIRKTDRKNQTDVPMLDDLHGSSEIGKTATKVITFGRIEHEDKLKTCISVMKNRSDGGRMYEAAIVEYDQQTQSYCNEYFVGHINYFNGKFKFATPDKYPHWALSSVNADKPASVGGLPPSGNSAIRSVPGPNAGKTHQELKAAGPGKRFSQDELGI